MGNHVVFLRPLGLRLGLKLAKGDYVYFAGSKNIFKQDFMENPVGIPLLPPPRRRAAGSPSTSPPPMLDQEGGDVAAPYVCWTRRCRSFGARIFGDLDHDEYDSINPVLLNASARDLQGYADALLFPSLIDDSID